MAGVAGVFLHSHEEPWAPVSPGCPRPDRHNQTRDWQQARSLELVREFAKGAPLLLLYDRVSPAWAEALPAGSQMADLAQLGSLDPATLQGRSVLMACELQRINARSFELLRRAKINSVAILRASRIVRVLLAPRKPGAGFLGSIRCSCRAVLVKLLTKTLPFGRAAHGFSAIGGVAYSSWVGNQDGSAPCMVLEDCVPLLWPDADPESAAELGRGRHLRCGEWIHFSASDNSNPNNNGRSYRFISQSGWRWRLLRWMLKMENGEPFFMRTHLRDIGGIGAHTVCRLRESRGMDVLTAALKRHPFGARKPLGSRVLLFTSHMKAGGAERQIYNLARHLRNNGMNSSVLTMEREENVAGCYSPLLGKAGVARDACDGPSDAFEFGNFARMPALKRAVFFALPRRLQWRVWNLYTHLAVEKPDVLHCFLDKPNIVGALAGWMAEVPKVVLSIRNLPPSDQGGQMEWKGIYQKFYGLLATDPALVLTANSLKGMSDYTRWCGFGQERVLLTRNIVDLEEFRPLHETDRHRVRQSLGIPEAAPVVTGVFRMTHEKAPMRFLDVIERVAAILPRLTVLVCGEGKLTESFCAAIKRRKLQDRVRYLGVRRDVREILGASDMLLLTSEMEGTANVLLEAQALQIPVVATDVGGSCEAVQDGSTGFLRKPGNVDGLVSACLLLLQEHRLREQFGRAGRAFIEANFSVGPALEQLRDIYSLG